MPIDHVKLNTRILANSINLISTTITQISSSNIAIYLSLIFATKKTPSIVQINTILYNIQLFNNFSKLNIFENHDRFRGTILLRFTSPCGLHEHFRFLAQSLIIVLFLSSVFLLALLEAKIYKLYQNCCYCRFGVLTNTIVSFGI